MYQADARERLISNSRRITELSAEIEFRGGRCDSIALRHRIDKLAAEQEALTDTLFGVKSVRYGEIHRTVFSLEEGI